MSLPIVGGTAGPNHVEVCQYTDAGEKITNNQVMQVKILTYSIVLLIAIGLTGCGGSDSSEPRPDRIDLSVELPEDFQVQKGTEFSVEAMGAFTPFHPDVELTYSWTKIVYFKPLDELLADFGGDFQAAVLSLESDLDFSDQQTISDIAPEIEPGGYVQYRVSIGAVGYQFDSSSVNPFSLEPDSNNFSDVINVFVVEE